MLFRRGAQGALALRGRQGAAAVNGLERCPPNWGVYYVSTTFAAFSRWSLVLRCCGWRDQNRDFPTSRRDFPTHK